MSRGPKILITLGIVCNVLGWGAFIVGFVVLGVRFVDVFDAGLDPAGELDLVIDVPGDGGVDLDPGRYQVVALGPSLTFRTGQMSDAGGEVLHRGNFAEPDLVVTDPRGDEVALQEPSHERLTSSPDLDAVGLYEFTAETAGTYTLAATATTESGEVTEVGIGEARGLWDEAKGWVLATAVIVGGSLLGTLGILLLVGGIIWLIVGRATTNRTPPLSPPPPGPIRTF